MIHTLTRSATLAAALMLAAGGGPVAAAPAQELPIERQHRTLRLMPLGDSLTGGGEEFASFRYPLWQRLQEGDVRFDFVGSQVTVRGGDGDGYPHGPWYPQYYFGFDRDHEGHPGERTVYFLPFVMTFVEQAQPDVVLLHLGTNDIIQKGSAALVQAPKNLRIIIGNIRAIRPVAGIVLAQLIPIGPNGPFSEHADLVPRLNDRIAEIAAELNTPHSPVLLVDQFTGFTARYFQDDVLHPNRAGEERMAAVWSRGLEDYLRLASPASADGEILDPSFEALGLADGESVEVPQGVDWSFGFTPKMSKGFFNPTSLTYQGAGGGGTPKGGDGDEVAYIVKNEGGTSKRAFLYQTLTRAFEAGRDYRLTVAVGRRLLTDPEGALSFGGYRVDLMAGNEIVGSTADTVVPPLGRFRDVRVNVLAADLEERHYGQLITVRCSLTSTSAGAATDFDYLRLRVDPR